MYTQHPPPPSDKNNQITSHKSETHINKKPHATVINCYNRAYIIKGYFITYLMMAMKSKTLDTLNKKQKLCHELLPNTNSQ